MRYSIELKDGIYVKGYGVLSFAKSMCKNLSNKYSQKPLDCAKKTGANTIKAASKRFIQKAVEETGDLIGNKTADKITNAPKKSSKELHSQKEEAINEIPKERYISPVKRQKIIDELKLV